MNTQPNYQEGIVDGLSLKPILKKLLSGLETQAIDTIALVGLLKSKGIINEGEYLAHLKLADMDTRAERNALRKSIELLPD